MEAPRHILEKMKAPGDRREGAWRGGIIQIKILNACDLDCKNCSAGVGIAKATGRRWYMRPEQFRAALQSLKGFPGVIGMFGGNPCIHPNFEELCEIASEAFPQEQLGLWSNRLYGHGDLCRRTFNPLCSNLNTHGNQRAYDEIKRDWPEARPVGLTTPSMHGPLFGAPTDLGYTPGQMWEAVATCDINQHWSAAITVVRGELMAYFCEIAATQAEVEGAINFGMEVHAGWWRAPMAFFAPQVEASCTRCLVPLRPAKVDAAGGQPELYTRTWAPTLLTVKGRATREVASAAELVGPELPAPATKYL